MNIACEKIMHLIYRFEREESGQSIVFLLTSETFECFYTFITAFEKKISESRYSEFYAKRLRLVGHRTILTISGTELRNSYEITPQSVMSYRAISPSFIPEILIGIKIRKEEEIPTKQQNEYYTPSYIGKEVTT